MKDSNTVILELHIENFAVIDRLGLAFSPGLNIFSGETGAGKSIIAGAVEFLVGGRASSDLIRTGEDEAVVEAAFDISEGPRVRTRLGELGFDAGDELILRRIIARSGRNRIFVNGRLATLSALEAVGEELVDIYGQHEHQFLLRPERHAAILDAYGGLSGLCVQVASLYDRLITAGSDLDKAVEQQRRMGEREELIDFQIKEIDRIRPEPEEDEHLEAERRILRNAEKLYAAASGAEERLYSGEGTILEGLSALSRDLEEAKSIDPALAGPAEALTSAAAQVEDAALELRSYRDRVPFEPARLEEVEDRLAALGSLKRKYGGSIEAVLEHREAIEADRGEIAGLAERIESLRRRHDELSRELIERAAELSERRSVAGRRLASAVEQELGSLRMARTSFQVALEPRRKGLLVEREGEAQVMVGKSGMNRIEFRISPNPGEALRPLARIASGGELSRIMLALRRILVDIVTVSTLIFDEVDAGIGAAVAEVVGRKLRDVAHRHQILCITHLPQMAVFAESHFAVSKNVAGERTFVSVHKLGGTERIEEVARMMAGTRITKKTIAYAREMISAAGDSSTGKKRGK